MDRRRRRASRLVRRLRRPDLDPRCGSRTTCPRGARAPSRGVVPPATTPRWCSTFPADHPLWCPDDHAPPLRVSGMQSGSYSGPVGSTIGQQPFRDGQVVREEQPRFEGCLADGGHVAIRCRMDLSPRSMAALWLSGFEDHPEQLRGDLRGRGLRHARCRERLGRGGHAASRPSATPTWSRTSPRRGCPSTCPTSHTYAVDWDADEAVFTVDGGRYAAARARRRTRCR